MAKVSGIVSSLTVDDSAGNPQDISADVTQITLGTPTNLQDVTGLDKAAIERIFLLKDVTCNITGVADFATGMEHDVFKADPAGTGQRSVSVALANAAATLSFNALLGDYTFTRNQDGSLGFTATLPLADGTAPSWS